MRGASSESCRRIDEVVDLVEKLLAGIPLFFDKRLALNSDGRRLLAKAARACDDGVVKARIVECLRDPTLERVARLYQSLTGRDPWGLVYDSIDAWGRRGSDGP